MNLSERIIGIIGFRSQELYYLLQFVKEFDAYILNYYQPKDIINMLPDMPSNIRNDLLDYAKEFSKFLSEFVAETQKPNTRKGREREFKTQKEYPREVTQYFFPLIHLVLKPIRYPKFLYDMVVTHVITLFESFLREFLVAIFTLRTKTMKSENLVTYKDILSFSTMKELISYLANNKVEKILNGDLKRSVTKNLIEVFSIDISKFEKFDILYEAFCRRHIIVHNDGKTDEEYCQKIPNSKIRVVLSTDLHYIETVLITMGQFMEYLDSYFSSKMRYRRNPTVNQLLYPPDSVEK